MSYRATGAVALAPQDAAYQNDLVRYQVALAARSTIINTIKAEQAAYNASLASYTAAVAQIKAMRAWYASGSGRWLNATNGGPKTLKFTASTTGMPPPWMSRDNALNATSKSSNGLVAAVPDWKKTHAASAPKAIPVAARLRMTWGKMLGPASGWALNFSKSAKRAK